MDIDKYVEWLFAAILTILVLAAATALIAWWAILIGAWAPI
jgi:hypothetical protein